MTLEDVLAIADVERPNGVIVQFGGQTPLKLVEQLEAAGVPIIGTSADAIDRAEDRQRFQAMLRKLGLKQPSNRTATGIAEGVAGAEEIGYPIVVRPSYVLGGRAMGDRLQPGRTGPVPARRRGCLQRCPGAARPVSGPGHRSGRRCGERWPRRADRRDHGAHRTGGRAFRRFRLRPASLPAGRGDPGSYTRAGSADGAGTGRGGPDEHPVRHPGERGVRVGGQSACIAHGAVRVQVHRRIAGQGRCALHGGHRPRGAGFHPGRSSRLASTSRSRTFRSTSFPAWTPFSARR